MSEQQQQATPTPAGPPPYQAPQPLGAQSPPRRLTRSRDDRVIAGVCGGLAKYLDVDATLVRVITVLAVIFGFGTALVAYVAAWILLPEE